MTIWVLALFFLSGVSGLVYQVIWVREFGIIFGATVSSAATVSAVFMMGLGVGSYLAGRYSDHLYQQARSAPLRAYGLFEVAIAVLGLSVALVLPELEGISAWLISYREGTNGWFELSMGSQMLRFGVAVVLLAPVTLLMGGTLTLLIRYLVGSELDLAGWRIGALYGLNTLGAAVGAFVTDFALIPSLGVFRSELFAVSLNAVAGLGALGLAVRAGRGKGEAARSAVGVRGASTLPSTLNAPPRWALFGMAIALLCSGIAAMGMEIVWFRYLISSLRSIRSIFSLLLTVILLGIFLGSILGGWLERRTGKATTLYLVTQSLFVATTIFAFVVYDPRSMGIVDPVSLSLAAARDTSWTKSLLEVAFSLQKVLLLAGVPALLMGCTFPLANAYVQRIEVSVGRQSGVLYLANTVGNVIGAAGVGLILLPRLGMQRTTILLMSLVGLGLVALYGTSRRDRGHSVAPRIAFACVAVVAGSLALLVQQPADELLRRTLPHFIVEQDAGRMPGGTQILALQEGVNETVAVVRSPKARALYTNGHSMSAVGPAASRYMRLFSHLPLLNSSEPKSALVICFGVGTTLHAASLYSTMERLDVAEISHNVLEHASYFSDSNRDVLEDPRVRVHVNDGRQHLRMQPAETYDLVTLEPPPINFAGVASLYSKEFYELAKSRLREGGYLTQWLPGYQVSGETNLAIVKAFVDVFPGAILASGWDRELILMGKKGGDTVLDIERVRASLAAEPRVRADLADIDVHSLRDLVATFAAPYRALANATSSADPVTDDDPVMEYDALTASYDNRMPAEMFDVSSLRSWCPDCYEGAALRSEFAGLEELRKAMAAYYASDAFLHFELVPGETWQAKPSREVSDLLWGDPCVTAELRKSPYWSQILARNLEGVPQRACNH